MSCNNVDNIKEESDRNTQFYPFEIQQGFYITKTNQSINFKVDIAGVPNLISEIQTSIKHYCNKTFDIDLSLLENFSDAKKRKISEDAVIKLINE